MKETFIIIGSLLSLFASLYLVKCGAKTDHTYIDVEPRIECEEVI